MADEEEADVAAMLDLSKKKKKKKKKTSDDTKEGPNPTSKEAIDMSAQEEMLAAQDAEQEREDPYDKKAVYTYFELLDKVVEVLQTNNPALVEKKKRNIKPPVVTMTSKKTCWVNFQEICTMIERSSDHVFQFFMAELGTEGSIDGNQRLVIRGKFVPKYLESLLRKYVVEYVTCQMCRSPNTDLVKDGASRLYFCHCRDCGSSRSVAPIRSGYHATSRADRRAAKFAKG
jgi:translation initiation factor 2 subunit 2